MEQERLFESPQNLIETYFPQGYRKIFAMSFALILLTHFYMFTNLFINHDNISSVFDNCSFGLIYGRWLLPWATKLAGSFSSPWLDGIVAALFLAAACMVFAAVFHIHRPLPACLLSLCMVAFPTVTSIYTYMFTSSQYVLALLLSVLAAWLFHRQGVVRSLLGILCIACSMGLYQAFFCLSAAVLVLTMLVEVCEGRWREGLKGFFVTGLRYLVCLALGLILYLIITKLCLWYTGTALVDYQGISSMGQITLPTLLHRIKEAYHTLFLYYFRNPMYSGMFPALVKISLVVDATLLGLFFWTRKLYKNAASLLQLGILLVLFPLACNSIYLMVETWTVHNLMIYPALLPLLLPVILGNQVTTQDLSILIKPDRQYMRTLTVLLACGILLIQAAFGYQFFVIANRAYTCMELTYESTYAYFTRLTAKIELQEGYTPDTHVAFLGNATQPPVAPDVHVTGVLTTESAINMYSRYKFLHYFMSSSYHYASQEEVEAVKASLEFRQMPCYPAEGSIRTIDGVIAVKLGE